MEGNYELSALLTLATGYTYFLRQDEIVSYELSEGAADGEMLLGAAPAGHARLVLSNPNGAWQRGGSRLGQRSLFGALALVQMNERRPEGVRSVPLGSFFVSEIVSGEGEDAVTLAGYDHMAHALSQPLEDTLVYPQTVGDILKHIVGQTGSVLLGEPACNAAVTIAQKPDWGSGCTLRRALAWTAAALGCFVQFDRSGHLRLLPVRPAAAKTALTAADALQLRVSSQDFCLNRVRIVPRSGRGDAEPVDAALVEGLPAAADNTLEVRDNALFRPDAPELPALAQGLLQALGGWTLTPFEGDFVRGAELTVGSRVTVAGVNGTAQESAVFSTRVRVAAEGLTVTLACGPDTAGVTLPTVLSGSGLLDGAALGEGVVTARHLAAGCVDAEKLSARSITADKLALGTLTGDSGVFGALSADLITAGKLSADRLIVGGSEFSIVRALNQLAQQAAAGDDRIAGGVLADRSVSAAKVTDDFGTGLELSSNAAVLLLAGKLDGTNSHLELSEEAINMVGGEINIATDDLQIRGMGSGRELMSLDPEGLSANRVVVREEFYAPNAVLSFAGGAIPWRGSIGASLRALPKYLLADATLQIPAGTYPEEVELTGFKGAAITLRGEGVTLIGQVTARQCDRVQMIADGAGGFVIYPADAAAEYALGFYGCGGVSLQGLSVSGWRGRVSAGTDYGILLSGCPFTVTDCCVEYTDKAAILATRGAGGLIQGCRGGCEAGGPATNANLQYGVQSHAGAQAAVEGTVPMAISGNAASLGTLLGSGTPTAGGIDYVAPTKYTKTFAVTKHCTYLMGVRRTRDDQSAQVAQGNYGGQGWNLGALWFGDVARELKDKTVLSASLTLRRAGGGYSNPVPVWLCAVDIPEESYAATLSPDHGTPYNMGTLAREKQDTYDVTWLAGVLKLGGGVGVYEPPAALTDAWSPAYTQFYGKGSAYEPTLTVTYR